MKADKLKAILVSGPSRLSALPQVPTAEEAGLKGFDLDSWFALYAPAQTPPEIVQTLNAQIGRILAAPEIRRKAEDAGTTVQTMTPAELGQFTAREYEAWGKVIRAAQIAAD